jgi:hypothetical protein
VTDDRRHTTTGRPEPFRAGDGVVLREVWHGRVWRVNVARVVEDGPDRIVLWFPRGGAAKYPVDADGLEMRIPAGAWTLADRVGSAGALALYQPGGRHSVWTFRHADLSHAHWYVNFEQPLRRTDIGFDYEDEKLDLIVEADGTWRWKDEDELAEAGSLGLLDADEVWRYARRLVADPPWPTGYEDWRPDPMWTVPDLPAGWDRAGA